jgi:long-subunit acyl-CoA synthetase (AMP-forming)
LDTAISTQTTAFAGVPWVLKGFMKAWKTKSDEACRAHIMEAIKIFKVFSGGASMSAECIEWAKQVNLPVLLDLGMTEGGGMIDPITRNQCS